SVPILDRRPASIIEGHGTTHIVIPQSAQIGNFVARLSDCVAEASQNNRRNPRYPEIPQPFMCAHISSFPPVKSWCRDDSRFTSGTARRSNWRHALTASRRSCFFNVTTKRKVPAHFLLFYDSHQDDLHRLGLGQGDLNAFCLPNLG